MIGRVRFRVSILMAVCERMNFCACSITIISLFSDERKTIHISGN